MKVRPDIAQLTDAVERFAGRTFVHRAAVEAVLELTVEKTQLRDDLLFYAKFVANAYQVLARAGGESEDTEKLAKEFQANLEKAHELLRTALKEAPPEEKARLVERYLSLSHGGMADIIGLFRDLAWVKNYQIDHKGAR